MYTRQMLVSPLHVSARRACHRQGVRQEALRMVRCVVSG